MQGVHAVHALERVVGTGLVERSARVGEDGVDPAPPIDGRSNQLGELRGIRHVAGDAERVRALRDQVGGRTLRLGVGEPGEHHARARRGESLGARPPDAGARAGDDRDLPRAREERVGCEG